MDCLPSSQSAGSYRRYTLPWWCHPAMADPSVTPWPRQRTVLINYWQRGRCTPSNICTSLHLLVIGGLDSRAERDRFVGPHHLKHWIVLIMLLTSLLGGVDADGKTVYLNKWAVHIRGGPSVADQVAAERGFKNHGQVSVLLFIVDY